MTDNRDLVFSGSIWCNLDIALRKIDKFFKAEIRPNNVTIIEWYILRALYEQDGQHASELAKAVGRAATSFTPNLDKLQAKGLIIRRGDKADRRAVRIYLTPEGESFRDVIVDNARNIDTKIREMFSEDAYENFQHALHLLGNFSPNGK